MHGSHTGHTRQPYRLSQAAAMSVPGCHHGCTGTQEACAALQVMSSDMTAVPDSPESVDMAKPDTVSFRIRGSEVCILYGHQAFFHMDITVSE